MKRVILGSLLMIGAAVTCVGLSAWQWKSWQVGLPVLLGIVGFMIFTARRRGTKETQRLPSEEEEINKIIASLQRVGGLPWEWQSRDFLRYLLTQSRPETEEQYNSHARTDPYFGEPIYEEYLKTWIEAHRPKPNSSDYYLSS